MEQEQNENPEVPVNWDYKLEVTRLDIQLREHMRERGYVDIKSRIAYLKKMALEYECVMVMKEVQDSYPKTMAKLKDDKPEYKGKPYTHEKE